MKLKHSKNSIQGGQTDSLLILANNFSSDGPSNKNWKPLYNTDLSITRFLARKSGTPKNRVIERSDCSQRRYFEFIIYKIYDLVWSNYLIGPIMIGPIMVFFSKKKNHFKVRSKKSPAQRNVRSYKSPVQRNVRSYKMPVQRIGHMHSQFGV